MELPAGFPSHQIVILEKKRSRQYRLSDQSGGGGGDHGNLAVLVDACAMLWAKMKAESSGQCNIGRKIVKEEEDSRNKMKRKTSGGGGVDASRNEKKRPKITSATKERRPPNPHAWVIKKLHDMSLSSSGDGYLWVFSKEITESDTKKDQNRLLLPRKDDVEAVLLEPLTEEERYASKLDKGLEVSMVDGSPEKYPVFLKFLTSTDSYRIKGPGWSKYVADNKLMPRLHTLHLCFFHLQPDHKELRLGVVKTMTDTLQFDGPAGKLEEGDRGGSAAGATKSHRGVIDLNLPLYGIYNGEDDSPMMVVN